MRKKKNSLRKSEALQDAQKEEENAEETYKRAII